MFLEQKSAGCLFFPSVAEQTMFTAATEQKGRKTTWLCVDERELTALGEFCLFVRVYITSCRTNLCHQHRDDPLLWLPARRAWQLALIQQITACLLGLFFFISMNTFWHSREEVWKLDSLKSQAVGSWAKNGPCCKFIWPNWLSLVILLQNSNVRG